MKNILKKINKQKGYTLLFAVLTASLVLGIAAFVVGVARKQHILSSTARDSMYAFYNADSAISCIVATWNYSSTTPNSPKPSCNGDDFDLEDFVVAPAPTPLGIYFCSTDPIDRKILKSANNIIPFVENGGCASVDIWSGYQTDCKDVRQIVFESRGYNACTEGNGNKWAPSTGARTVERAIRVTQ